MYLILESPLKLLKAGEFSASNVMVGVTRDDGDIFLADIPGTSPISLEICEKKSLKDRLSKPTDLNMRTICASQFGVLWLHLNPI